MENNEVIDIDELLEMIDGEKEFLAELIEIFIDDSPKQLSEIQKAVDNCNSEELEKSAHKLKGAISNFGQKAAFETALQLEMMGRNNRLDGVEEAYNTLTKDVECLANALKELVE